MEALCRAIEQAGYRIMKDVGSEEETNAECAVDQENRTMSLADVDGSLR